MLLRILILSLSLTLIGHAYGDEDDDDDEDAKPAVHRHHDEKKHDKGKAHKKAPNAPKKAPEAPKAKVPEASKPKPEAAKKAPEAPKAKAPEVAKPKNPEAPKKAPEAPKPKAPEVTKPKAPEAPKKVPEAPKPKAPEVKVVVVSEPPKNVKAPAPKEDDFGDLRIDELRRGSLFEIKRELRLEPNADAFIVTENGTEKNPAYLLIKGNRATCYLALLSRSPIFPKDNTAILFAEENLFVAGKAVITNNPSASNPNLIETQKVEIPVYIMENNDKGDILAEGQIVCQGETNKEKPEAPNYSIVKMGTKGAIDLSRVSKSKRTSRFTRN